MAAIQVKNADFVSRSQNGQVGPMVMTRVQLNHPTGQDTTLRLPTAYSSGTHHLASFAAFLVLSLCILAISTAAQSQFLDLIVENAVFATMDPRYPAPELMGIKDGRIAVLGTRDEVERRAGPATRRVDAQGGFIVPGFIESHGHFGGIGAGRRIVDLSGVRSFDEVLAKTRAAAEKTAPGTFIVGRGWDQNLWPQKTFPKHEELSRITPDHPVWLIRVDGHAGLANARLMRLAGINADTMAPAGGEIIRDSSGAATGVFIDAAMRVFSGLIPDTDDATLQADLQAAEARCFEEGITSFHDAGTSWETVDRLEALYSRKALKIRLYVMLGSSGARHVKALMERPPIIGRHNQRLTVRSLKLGVDGALGSYGAALLEDYSDRPGTRGLYLVGKKDLLSIGRTALENHWQVAIHAIGDGGNRLVCDAWEELFAEIPRGREARFRVEHAQIVDAADIPRFGQLGLIASMQGVHCTSDMPWVPTRIGEARTLEGAYVWRKFLDQGVVVSNGTDAPVENLSVIESFYASVTRRPKTAGPDSPAWQPDQRMSRLEALYSYTLAGAYAAFEENSKGSLTPGKLADFTCLSQNLLTCSDDVILGTQIKFTYVHGERVH